MADGVADGVAEPERFGGTAAGAPVASPASDRSAAEADERLVRGVRWRLAAWSGGVTLAILIVLGIALYVAVANSLAAAATTQLANRADEVARSIGRPGPLLGLRFGGDSSGTYAMLIAPDGDQVLPERDVPDGLPVASSATAALSARHDVVTTATIGDVPIRLLSRPVRSAQGTFVIQVVQDRVAEQRTLATTLLVLLGGGLLALLVASGFGAFYARRALVPIRQSLVNQRAALRRQREFAADASHELRTPLTVIRSSVEHLRRHRDEPVGAVGDAVEDIDAEVAHLTSLVDDLLLLARSDSGAVSLVRLPVDLGDVAADAASSLAKPAAHRSVRVVVDPEPTIVEGDPARLRQLVSILVDNAIRHSPPGGEVRVQVRVQGGSNGRAVELTVDDEGRGVRPEDMPRIFDRFWRAPGAPSGGTGLGLAIARWIVERHAGRIEVTNRPEGGARFTVQLPSASTP